MDCGNLRHAVRTLLANQSSHLRLSQLDGLNSQDVCFSTFLYFYDNAISCVVLKQLKLNGNVAKNVTANDDLRFCNRLQTAVFYSTTYTIMLYTVINMCIFFCFFFYLLCQTMIPIKIANTTTAITMRIHFFLRSLL